MDQENSHAVQIQLRKKYYTSQARNHNVTFNTCGYFDEVYFSLKNNISGLYIENFDEGNLDIGTEVQYICLGNFLFESPEKEFYGRYNKIIGNDNKLPLVVISGIKIHRNISDTPTTVSTRELGDRIHNTIKKSLDVIDGGNSILFETFLSLGFCEFVVIYRAHKYKVVMKSLLYLREHFRDIGTYSIPEFLYSIPGYQPNYNPTKEDADVYVHLASLKPSMPLPKLPLSNHPEMYPIFGGHDFMVITNRTTKEIPQSVRNLIKKTQTYVGIKLNNQDFEPLYSGMEVEEARKDIHDQVYRSKDLFEKYQKLDNKIRRAKDNERSILGNYQLYELRNLILFFSNFEYAHSIDKYLINEWTKIIEQFLTLLELAQDTVIYADDRYVDEQIKGIVSSFEKCISSIDHYAQPWIMGSQSMVESPIYSTFHIGSSTQISLVYSIILNFIESIFNNLNKKRNREEMVEFFAIPSWDTTTESYHLFTDLTTKRIKLIPIYICIGDYFNFNKLGLVFHEVGHHLTLNLKDLNELMTWLVCFDIFGAIIDEILGTISTEISPDHLLISSIRETLYNDLVENASILFREDVLSRITNYENMPSDNFNKCLYETIISYNSASNEKDDHYKIIKNISQIIIDRIREEKNKLITCSTFFDEEISKLRDIFSLSNEDCRIIKEKQKYEYAKVIARSEIANFKNVTNILLNYFMGKPISKIVKTVPKGINEYIFSVIGDEIRDSIDRYEFLIIEAMADYFMCRLLRFNEQDYSKLMKENKDTQVSAFDDKEQIGLRKRILQQANAFSPGSENKKNNSLTYEKMIADYISTLLSKDEIQDIIGQPIIKKCQEIIKGGSYIHKEMDFLLSIIDIGN